MEASTTPAGRRISAVVSGRVQGVGFRYFTKAKALHYGLTGWVRNLPEGGVELEAQGPAAGIGAFLDDIGRGYPLSHVSDVRVIELPLEQGENDFYIA